MERRMLTIGVAAVLLLASFALTAFTTGGEESSATPNPYEAQAGLQQPLDQGGIPEFDGPLSLNDIGLEEAVFTPNMDKMVSSEDTQVGIQSFNSKYSSLHPPTRASDAENEADQHDFANGSKLSSARETIDGTLTYDPDQGGSPDWRDWYKISVTDINELAKTDNGVRNVSVNLISYTDNSDGYSGLYEFTYDDTPAMTSEFGDILEINLIYYDPWVGYVDMGSSEFLFDDQDDTDGWFWDGDNLLHPGDNWTTRFVTPVNSDGAEDPDGFANGHTEEGWYYVGISLNFLIRDQVWSRDTFTIKYSLEIDTTTQEPTDQGSNAREDAQPYTGDDTKHLNSRFNQVDWYKFEGSDPSKIWNITGTMDRHVGFGIPGDDNNPKYVDNWIWTFMVWRGAGDDEEWNTADDEWIFDYMILAFFITGGRFVSNVNQNINFSFNSRVLESEHREMYIGVVMEPVMIHIEGGEIQGYYFYSDYPSWNNYTIDFNIVEEIPNTPPTLSDLSIESDWPGHETGGHFGSTFYFNITYTDEDDDPPEELNMVFDPESPDEVIYDMLQHEVDSGDTDYTDGKDYSFMILGEDFEDEYLVPPVILVNATDTIPIESIRIQGFTGNFYYNNTLKVWDDDPVYLNPAYSGEETITEDIEDSFLLEGNTGLIKDPKDSYIGFQAWNTTANEWKTDYDSDLMIIKVQQVLGDWTAIVTPKPDQYGEETVTFRGFDQYSNVSGDIHIVIEPVNDIPVVQSVEIDGTAYDVDNTRPVFPTVHLEDQVDVLQNSEIVIEIETIDIDNEDSEIIYTFKETDDGDWDGPIEVDENTGRITLTPNNNDIKKKNSEIVVEIDDGGGEIVELTIFLKLENVNDKPTIELDPSQNDVYERGDQISIIPRITDPDPDAIWTVSVNMLEEIDGVDPIIDQLPYAELVRDLDWTFNENVGRFTMKTDDWMIWNTSSGFNGIIKLTVVFEVTDNEDASANVQIELTLTSDPPPPPELDEVPTPTYIVEEANPDIPGTYGLKVTFKAVGTVTNIFGVVFEPKWEYNGEIISSEEEFEHQFEIPGLKTVYLYYEQGEDQTERRSVSINLAEVIIEPPEDPNTKGNESDFPIIPVVIIVIIILIVIVLVALFIVMRKKKEQEAGQEYYDETPRFGGRGHSQELGAQPRTHGLSPAREAEHAEKLPPKREAPGMSCPHCGASVQKGWFLCPECKNPLD